MNKKIPGFFLVLFLTVLLYAAFSAPFNPQSCSFARDAKEEILFWTCSMHPSIKLPDPGKCPICAMDLIPVRKGEEDADVTMLKLSELSAMLAEIETAKVVERDLSIEMRLPARISYDETKIFDVSAWTGGRIERLYVNFRGDYIQKGEPLYRVYSPELNLAQKEYLTVYKRRENVSSQTGPGLNTHENARRKLLLLGILPSQINELEKRGVAADFIDIHAPVSGVVIERYAFEGGYVTTGERLFRVAELRNLWVELEVYENSFEHIKTGQEVEFISRAYPAEKFMGRVVFLDPFLDTTTRTARARVEIPNPDMKLKPGMFGYAVVKTLVGNYLSIPYTAPLLTGRRSLVYIETESRVFEPREVELLQRAGDFYPVASGLAEGEKVVTRGNFKIDASLQIRGQPGMVDLLRTSLEQKHQTHCPVMGGRINRDFYTDVKGYRIYVCCPGCTDVIEQDPQKYIEKLKQEGVTPEKTPAVQPPAVHHH